MKSPFASKRFWLNTLSVIVFGFDQYKEFIPPAMLPKIVSLVGFLNLAFGLFSPTPTKAAKLPKLNLPSDGGNE